MQWTGAGVRRAACLALLGIVGLAGCGSTAQSGPPPGSAADGEVVAVVNGTAITTGEVEAALGATLAKLQEQAYNLKRQQLDALIAEKLIAAEAERRGVSPEALVQQEVTSQVPAVTDADVQAFVAANRQRLPGDPAALTPQIRAYLAEQREAARRETFVESLRSKASIDVRLPPPPVYRAPVTAADAPVRGPADAPVTIVEFSDFHCPYCRAVQPTLMQVLAKYPTQVRLAYRHLPLDELHPQARRVAEASWCAAEQGKFWPFHDRVYAAGGSDASEATLHRFAREAGVDVAKLDECLASGRAAGPVQRDVAEAQKHGVTGTPGFFVNGRLLSGNQPLEAFVSVIEEELQRTRQ